MREVSALENGEVAEDDIVAVLEADGLVADARLLCLVLRIVPRGTRRSTVARMRPAPPRPPAAPASSRRARSAAAPATASSTGCRGCAGCTRIAGPFYMGADSRGTSSMAVACQGLRRS